MIGRLKKFKRLQLKYDKKINTFKSTIFLIINILIIESNRTRSELIRLNRVQSNQLN